MCLKVGEDAKDVCYIVVKCMNDEYDAKIKPGTGISLFFFESTKGASWFTHFSAVRCLLPW